MAQSCDAHHKHITTIEENHIERHKKELDQIKSMCNNYGEGYNKMKKFHDEEITEKDSRL